MKLTLLYHHQMLNTLLHGTSPYGLYLHSYCPCLNIFFVFKYILSQWSWPYPEHSGIILPGINLKRLLDLLSGGWNVIIDHA